MSRSACAWTAIVLAGCVGAIGAGTGGGAPAAPDGTGAGSLSSPMAAPPVTSAPTNAAGLPSAALGAVSGLRRLTSVEYDNTLRDVLGDRTRPSRQILPADARIPFDNDFTVQVPSAALVDGLELLAREAVQRLLADKPRRDMLVGCTPAAPGDGACYRSFVGRFGRRALRRPLATDEIARYEKAFLPLAVESGDFYAAVEATLQALLQHVEFVYRVEIGAPVKGQPRLFALNDWEIGTRLAYLLWGGPPDDPLLDTAQAGALGSATGVRAAATRMMKDQRAKDLIARFHALWLRYEGLQAPSPDLGAAMQAESAALVRRVVFDEQRPWQDVFRLGETFVSDVLAKHYGLPAPGSASGAWVSYGTTGRRGLLSHATFLSNGTGKGGDSSPTMRGIAVRELLLCETIPPPPPGVNADEPPPATAAASCKEDRYAAHRSQGACASCHQLLDPVGFGLENYDPLGRYRTKEAGNAACAVRGDGEVVGLGKFHGPAELADLLLRSGRLNACVISQLYRFAVGRNTLDDNDKRLVALLNDKLGGPGADFKLDDLVYDFVTADSFRYRREEQ